MPIQDETCPAPGKEKVTNEAETGSTDAGRGWQGDLQQAKRLRMIPGGIFYAPRHKSCYTPPLRDIVVFVLSQIYISLKTTPVMVGAVWSFYVF